MNEDIANWYANSKLNVPDEQRYPYRCLICKGKWNMRQGLSEHECKPKGKYPTPDQFVNFEGRPAKMYVEDAYEARSKVPLGPVLSRQLDAANHAIAHLRVLKSAMVKTEFDDIMVKAFSKHQEFRSAIGDLMDFLHALDHGEDFPEMPK